ncbi:myosin heavy chain [Salpingoeca rosetta]|uniref:Myosin heavy chain n=1 Tax=Salpingoeca rosetta (strain ATCC 50818 / BSB-021) TaxID=946362 RepID=F2TYV8_SALR5|nr:myosin heavy chain [Salpingoeca rosetta]EGD78782.1 myosin heavy chain [Salpingoeca rosetta]|eukprot:XP_004997738.1 myosin heavy chain [Salpingoeca rosetta]
MATMMHDDGAGGLLDNLAELSNLTSETILDQLKRRYEANLIYTYVGDILVATNPYQMLPIYTEEVQEMYKGASNKQLPPHIFAVADRAYEAMLYSQVDQCFVISGESGAGKTESTKKIVQHIVELCRAGNTELEDRIKTVNVFLEAFGNAKTVMNNNSSRFGKYLELRFDRSGAVQGATLSHYLLEKSRISFRNDGEQNFHIFYQLFAGLKDEGRLEHYGLAKPSDHNYLRGAGAPSDEQVLSSHFGQEWREVMGSFEFIGFAKGQTNSMIDMLVAILHIGDITFEPAPHDSVTITCTDKHLALIAKLLKISFEELKNAIVATRNITRGELVTRNFDEEKAAANRDATAKAIYARIFSWIFRSINDILKGNASHDCLVLGLLDIFGFENFKINSLEQMCINITNEQLQQFFNQHIFVYEQEEYKKEGVDFSKIDFVDNQATLDLFLKKPQGIFSILDEESRFPKATDLTFTEKCTAALTSHPSRAFKPPRSQRDLCFTITHYAGTVEYQSTNFLEKNRDTLSQDVISVLAASTDPLVSQLFDPTANANATVSTNKRQQSLTAGFKVSLVDLVKRLKQCHPHFVRCIKPNAEQMASRWEEDLVSRQLTYSGVLETIKIRKMGYSFRLPFQEFVTRYKIIAYKFHENPMQSSETCQVICSHAKLDDYQVGHNKVFMKYNHAEVLADLQREQSSALVFLQKIVKAHVARTKFSSLLQEKRKQDRRVTDFLTIAETRGTTCTLRMDKLKEEDAAKQEDRKWLTRVKKQAARAEARRAQKEAERQARLEAIKNEPAKVKTLPHNGFFVWERAEHLDLHVGPLPPPWKKKIDKRTNRHYFKNMESKVTTWVDPRSYEYRKHDPLETQGDELPYGWDEAETEDGVVFYINHLDGTHHPEHPRVTAQRKQEQIAKEQAEQKARADERRETLRVLRDKKRRLQGQLAEATDSTAIANLHQRIEAIDNVIRREISQLESVQSALRILQQVLENQRRKRHRIDPDRAVRWAAARWLAKIRSRRAPVQQTAF